MDPKQYHAETVVKTPDQLQLILAVFDPALPDGTRRTITLVLLNGSHLAVELHNLEFKDGDGTEFSFHGSVSGKTTITIGVAHRGDA